MHGTWINYDWYQLQQGLCEDTHKNSGNFIFFYKMRIHLVWPRSQCGFRAISCMRQNLILRKYENRVAGLVPDAFNCMRTASCGRGLRQVFLRFLKNKKFRFSLKNKQTEVCLYEDCRKWSCWINRTSMAMLIWFCTNFVASYNSWKVFKNIFSQYNAVLNSSYHLIQINHLQTFPIRLCLMYGICDSISAMRKLLNSYRSEIYSCGRCKLESRYTCCLTTAWRSMWLSAVSVVRRSIKDTSIIE